MRVKVLAEMFSEFWEQYSYFSLSPSLSITDTVCDSYLYCPSTGILKEAPIDPNASQENPIPTLINSYNPEIFSSVSLETSLSSLLKYRLLFQS
jgi:hypothetical protein